MKWHWEKLNRQTNECHGRWIAILDDVSMGFVEKKALEGSKDSAIWIFGERAFQEVGTAGSNALTRNLTGSMRNRKLASVAGTESPGEITRDEVSEVLKPRSCIALLAIVRILAFTLSSTGNPRKAVEWRNHMITLVAIFKIGYGKIIPLLFISQPPNLFSLSPCLFLCLKYVWNPSTSLNFFCHYLSQANENPHSFIQLVLIEQLLCSRHYSSSQCLEHSSKKIACVELTFLPWIYWF